MQITRENTPTPLPYIRPQHNDMPDPAEIEPLDRSAAKVITSMHALITETAEARSAVVESRYKGSAWMAAEKADRAAVTNGEKPTAIAALIAGEPERYGLALALIGLLESRLDATRHDGAAAFAKAVTKARQQQTAWLDDAAALVEQGWPKRATARGLVHLEDAQRLIEQAQRLEALIRWLDGTDRRIDQNREHFVALDPVTRGRLTAYLIDQRPGVPLIWNKSMGTRPNDWKPAGLSSTSLAG